MAEYIERSDALKVIETANSMVSRLLESTMKLCMTMNSIAAADVAPVRHGRWVSVFDIGTVCNQCGYDIEQHGFDVRTDGEPNYCPNCGAKMDKDGDGE